MTNYVLIAFILLSSPRNNDQYEYDDPLMRDCIILISKHLQLIDEREDIFRSVYHEEQSGDSFSNTVEMLSQRYKELNDAPLAETAFNFIKIGWDYTFFNMEHRTWLLRMKEIHECKREYFDEWIKENQKISSAYAYIAAAQREDHNILPTRRIYLKEAKKIIGDRMFYEGRLPPLVPAWRFSPIRID